LFDGGFDLGERAHAREDAETPALRKHSAAAAPFAKSACSDTTISPSLFPLNQVTVARS
jgi:hypothetical protein